MPAITDLWILYRSSVRFRAFDCRSDNVTVLESVFHDDNIIIIYLLIMYSLSLPRFQQFDSQAASRQLASSFVDPLLETPSQEVQLEATTNRLVPRTRT